MRLLVTAAGGGASNNLIRAIRARGEPATIIGTSVDRFYLARSLADRNYLVPRGDAGRAYIDALAAIVARERIDLVIANNDAEVGPVSRYRGELGARVFLPAAATIERCQDKLTLSAHLAARGVPVAETHEVPDLPSIEGIFDRLGRPETVWCRMRSGSASRGSLPVRAPQDAESWIRYWNTMRGVPVHRFLLCEYLPGRDYAFQSLWCDGELVIAKACERLEYLCGEWMPSGQTSTPRVARLVDSPAVNRVCVDAVQCLDPAATGMFCIDLKENAAGVPCITEINIGRFFMISPIFNLVGRHNMADLYVRLAFGREVEVGERERFGDIGDEETYLVRELDCEPAILTRAEIEASSIPV